MEEHLKNFLNRNDDSGIFQYFFGSPLKDFERRNNWTVYKKGKEKEIRKKIFWKFITCQHKDDIEAFYGNKQIIPLTFESKNETFGINFDDKNIKSMNWESVENLLN